jgi:ubiquinone/menaquinone biosynthesis C-methylase UbiE
MGGMDEPYPSQLHVWPGPAAAVHDLPLLTNGRGTAGPADVAQKLYAHEAFGPAAAMARAEETAEPYSLQWFLNIENQRHGRHGRWIPRLLEFAKHAGETLAGIGNGLGTDWLQYARHGASVVVCSPSAEQLALIRRNFELRGLPGRFQQAPATALPLESSSIDVTCVSTLLQECPDPRALVDEVYRVLKPGGKVLAVTPAQYDVDFWYGCCFPWQHWLRRGRAGPAGPARFTARALRRLFGQFAEHRVYKRHLRRSEVPHVWRWLPHAVLERLMGRVLVLKAFKPLSAAMGTHMAA